MDTITTFGEVAPLEDQFEIDDRLAAIMALEKEIDRQKLLKQRRVESIDVEIKRLDKLKEDHRGAILVYMAANEEKTLNYPGVGKVSRRPGSGKWVVTDDESVIKFLESTLEPEHLKSVIKQAPKLVKKELDKVLNQASQQGAKLPDGVEYERATDVLSITFDKGESLDQKVRDLKEVVVDSVGPRPVTAANYDGLEI